MNNFFHFRIHNGVTLAEDINLVTLIEVKFRAEFQRDKDIE